MSLSKDQPIEDTIRRDSFSDRICDDLSEFILKYLSINVQLRLRCVSKQFQRTILSAENISDFYYRRIHFANNSIESLKKFEYIFQTFPKINSNYPKIFWYDFDDDYNDVHNEDFPDKYNPLLTSMVKYCPNLAHIAIFLIKLNQDNIEMLSEMFSSSLVSFEALQIRWGLINFLTLDEFLAPIKVSNVQNLIVNVFCNALAHIKFNKLEKFQVGNDFGLFAEHLNDFEVFAENNGKTVKQLVIDCPNIVEKESFKRLLRIITKFNYLVYLKIISIRFQFNDKFFSNNLKQIAVDCNYLKSLGISLVINPNNNQPIEELLQPFKQFKQLKRLALDLCKSSPQWTQIVYESFSINDIKGFDCLTHFQINYIFETQRNGKQPKYCLDTILAGIDTNLPNLRSLKLLNVSFETISDESVDMLCRLSQLESIRLKIEIKLTANYVETKLQKNCKRIRNIQLNP